MSLIETVSHIKDDALNSVLCPVVMRLGIQGIPAASLLIGEVSLSGLLHYGVILPSPIGVELLDFPSRMIYFLERRRLMLFKVSRIPSKFASFFQKARG
ncbi:MAG TPA: hypothetical protein VJ742_04735 [Nitrososphaera sp.]|nr:hypothetical protein [Nitrososphaera sp.]